MKKILITGGKGMIGQYFENFPFCYITNRQELDVTNLKRVKEYIKSFNPTAIIHLAAETDVDFCEKNPNTAYKINSEGAKNVAEAAKQQNCLIVYLSTAAVFSGEGSKPFIIDDTPNPVNVYGKSKLEGERLVKKITDKYLIIRTGWIFGGFERDKKFVSLIANQIWNGSKKVSAVDDIYGCPTYGKDLASAISQLIDKKKLGIVHVVNKGYVSRFEIAIEIAKILDPTVEIEPVKSTKFPAFNALRPKFEVIKSTVLLRPWQQALKGYLQEWIRLRKSRKMS